MERACFDVPACDWLMVTPGMRGDEGLVHLGEELARHVIGSVEQLVGGLRRNDERNQRGEGGSNRRIGAS